MGAVAQAGADRLVITSDNPRSEEPQAIIEAIAAGAGDAARRIADRRQAIRFAIDAAAEGDTVLIAGKGHEDYQQVAGERLPFSDAVEARLALRRRVDRGGEA
jgi:UDP-N-acetylmuramoyl-L-alanyl-D-glutamate--2,6-diaminopimelate ligase